MLLKIMVLAQSGGKNQEFKLLIGANRAGRAKIMYNQRLFFIFIYDINKTYKKQMKKVVITSGFFNPIHIGHINLMREAKKLGDILVVIVNNDNQVKIKGKTPFMQERERAEIIKELRCVDEVFLAIDKDISVGESLRVVAQKYSREELFFAKGGDRNSGNIPESEINACKEFNIKIINDVGGGKVQSSSWLLANAAKNNKPNGN